MTEGHRSGRLPVQSNENDRILIGTRLKDAREYLQLSQDEVAKILEIPRTAISLMEAGQRKVDAIELKKLSRIYQRPIDYFTGGTMDVVAPIPESVQHLARTAAKLSDRDREELLQFARFLQSRQSTRDR
jgi:transcriptional regulator with XRE-family HTH domain